MENERKDSPSVQLAELRRDVQNLADIVNEMRVEAKDWRERQVRVLEELAASRAELSAISGAYGHLLCDVERLKAWRWYMIGVCGAVASGISMLGRS